MRTNITISLDPAFIDRMDAKRGSMPRSRWLEAQCDEQATPVIERSPEPPVETEEPYEAPVDKWGNPVDTVYDEDDPRGWT